MGNQPPKLFIRFLQWYCHPDLEEEIIGDTLELFYWRVDEEGPRSANWKFRWDVIRFFRPSNTRWSRQLNIVNMGILRSYFKVGIRNIYRNKVTSAINIIGLSLAISFALVCFAFLNFTYTSDTYHSNHARIHMVENYVNRDGDNQLWGNSPEALGPALKADLPFVEEVGRMERGSAIMKYRSEVFRQRLYFADPGFLDMFDYKVKWGEDNALKNPSQIVLSERASEKYFADRNPVGEQVTLVFTGADGEEIEESFLVGAVLQKFHWKSSFTFDVLVPYETRNRLGFQPETNWKNFVTATFVLLQSPGDAPALVEHMSRYRETQNKANLDWPIQKFASEPLTTICENNYKMRASISMGGHAGGRIVLVTIAFLLLTLACFNYMNIALASASRRLKEIGIRKVIGSRRYQLVYQFLAENLILCSLSVLAGLAIAQLVMVPVFNDMLPVQLQLDWQDVRVWTFTVALIAGTGLAGGAYPAFYISKFQPSQILSGSQKFRRAGWINKSILTIQYTIALVTMGVSAVLINNSNYMQNLDLGYKTDDMVVVRTGDHYEAFRELARTHKHVVAHAGAANPIGFSDPSITVAYDTGMYEVDHMRVGADYLQTMGVNLTAGRYFDANITSDSISAVIVNETLVKTLDIAEPLGATFKRENKPYYIIGVTNDFHFQIPFFRIRPAMMTVAQEPTNFIAEVNPGSSLQVLEDFKTLWYQIDPDTPFSGNLQTSAFETFNIEMRGESDIGLIIAVFAMIISCVGLFGITSLNIAKRLKEFSIRKVLGASLNHVTILMNKDILLIMLLGIAIATPLGYMAAKTMMEGIFAYHAPVTLVPFVISAGALLLTSLITISSKIYQVATVSPVDNLKEE